MPNVHTTLTSLFTAIANAIREKTGGTAPIVADDFPDEIAEITTEPVLQSKTVSPSTSQQVVTADSGYDGLDTVTVNAMRLQEKDVTPPASGMSVVPDTGYDGLSRVDINVLTQSKIITENGTYTPTAPAVGFSSVTVNSAGVPTQLTAQSLDNRYEVLPSDLGDYTAFNRVIVVPPELETKTITTNGTHRAGQDKFFKEVTVNVSSGVAVQETKNFGVIDNGTYLIQPDAGFDAMSTVNLFVNTSIEANINDVIFNVLNSFYPNAVARCSVSLYGSQSIMILNFDETVSIDTDLGFMCLFFGNTNDDLPFLFARCGNPYEYVNTIYFTENADDTVMNAEGAMINDVRSSAIEVTANFGGSSPYIDATVYNAVFVAFQ